MDLNQEQGDKLVDELAERAIFCKTNVCDEGSLYIIIFIRGSTKSYRCCGKKIRRSTWSK
jgi:hypothetical protein